jgi:hypothetical protein
MSREFEMLMSESKGVRWVEGGLELCCSKSVIPFPFYTARTMQSVVRVCTVFKGKGSMTKTISEEGDSCRGDQA